MAYIDLRASMAILIGAAALSARAEPFAFEAAYTGELWHVAEGAVGDDRYLDLLSLAATFDLESATGLPGELFAQVLYNNRTTLSDELIGDLHVVSSIDAPGEWRLFELWYQWQSEDEAWSVLFGLLDLNAEFDVNETGSLFVNGAHGIGTDIGQTGENGPSIFPVSGLTGRAAVSRGDWSLRAALIDGVPGNPASPRSNRIRLGNGDGTLLAAEASWDPNPNVHGHLGWWRYSGDFDVLDGPGTAKSRGWYLLGERRNLTIGSLSLGVFGRYGRTQGDVVPLEDYLGAGAVIEGLVPGRADDQVGIAVAHGGTSGAYRNLSRQLGAAPASAETNWELTYRAVVNDWLALQPNLQWVKNPGGLGDTEDAFVVGLRFEIAGSW